MPLNLRSGSTRNTSWAFGSSRSNTSVGVHPLQNEDDDDAKRLSNSNNTWLTSTTTSPWTLALRTCFIGLLAFGFAIGLLTVSYFAGTSTKTFLQVSSDVSKKNYNETYILGQKGDSYIIDNDSSMVAADDVVVEKSSSSPHFINPIYINGGQQPACKLDLKGPVPVALVTLGRSGSSSTWQVMGTLTGQETKSIEYTGSSGYKAKTFLAQWEDDDNGNWALKYLCDKQKEHPKAGIVGFKWKPFKEYFLHPKSLAALRMIAGSYNPQIKVVRSKRNALDRILSIYKHRQNDGAAPPHCQVGDEKCLKVHKQAAKGLEVPIDDMMKRLQREYKDEMMIDQTLQELGVPHVSVSFDELFYGERPEREWARIFEFLGVGPTKSTLTRETVEGAMMHAATSSPFHNETIANFNEVQSALKGTQFEQLLH